MLNEESKCDRDLHSKGFLIPDWKLITFDTVPNSIENIQDWTISIKSRFSSVTFKRCNNIIETKVILLESTKLN